MNHRRYILTLFLTSHIVAGCSIGFPPPGGTDDFTFVDPELGPPPQGSIVESVNLEGNITGNFILIAAKSPYYVIGELVVMKGAVLTVEAGTTIFFATDKGLYIDGNLDATGKSSDLIIFTSAKASPEAGDWRGIEFRDSNGSTMKHAKIEYAQAGVLTLNSSPEITSSIISQNMVGFKIEDGSSPKITMSDIYDNKVYDLQMIPSNSSTISSSTLDVSSNWWGTTDETVISENIFDASDDATLSTSIKYSPVSGVKILSQEE